MTLKLAVEGRGYAREVAQILKVAALGVHVVVAQSQPAAVI